MLKITQRDGRLRLDSQADEVEAELGKQTQLMKALPGGGYVCLWKNAPDDYRAEVQATDGAVTDLDAHTVEALLAQLAAFLPTLPCGFHPE